MRALLRLLWAEEGSFAPPNSSAVRELRPALWEGGRSDSMIGVMQ